MPPTPLVTPTQLLAGRAMLGLSQEELASAAKISPSTLRDIEASRRPSDGEAAQAVYRELDNRGVMFIPSDATGGPGVRFATHRPTLLRLPTVVTKWEGVPIEIEFQGKAQVAFVSREALANLDGLPGTATDAQLLDAVGMHRGRILEAAWRLIVDPRSQDNQGRVYIRTADLTGTVNSKRLATRLPIDKLSSNALVRLDPLPSRIWRGARQEPQDYAWRVERVAREKGLVVITNEVTGHFLQLYYPAHLWDVESIVDPKSREKFLLKLGVQIVFEDGHPRLERLA